MGPTFDIAWTHVVGDVSNINKHEYYSMGWVEMLERQTMHSWIFKYELLIHFQLNANSIAVRAFTKTYKALQ